MKMRIAIKKVLFRRLGNSILMGVATTMVGGLLFTVPFLSSVVNGARTQTELAEVSSANTVAKEVYDFLYAYKKAKGTLAFKTLIETGNGGDCANNDLNQNASTTDAVDWYCVAHITSTWGTLAVNHCTFSGGWPLLTDIKKLTCVANDTSYPDSFYEHTADAIKNTIVLKQDTIDSDIYSGYITSTSTTLPWASKVTNVIFY